MMMFKSGSMPVLNHIKRVFQAEFGHDFSKLPNRDNTLFVIIQHGFATIRPMMDVFLELGVQNKHVFMTTKPHTTSPEMLAYFQETLGTQYIPFEWETSESVDSSQSRYKHLTASTHRQLFEKFCDYLLRYPAPAYITNIIICDEGGKFLNEFINRYHNPDPRYIKKLSAYHVVAIEHTKCGTYREALARLPFPLINMADSYLKTQIESEFIAKSMFVNLNAILERIIDSSSAHIGVVGGGNIGREVIDFLRTDYPNASIVLYDREPSVLSLAKITELGWHNVSRVNAIQALFQQTTIILGCTGKDVTSTLTLEEIAANSASHIHLISCSSGDAEFQTLLQRMPNYQFKSLADMRDWMMPLDLLGEKKLTIYNGGFPINFLVHQPESVPVEEIQITRGMKLASLVQALKLLEVTPYLPNENSLTGYMQLDVFYQWEIIQAFYHDLMRSRNPERQAQIQRRYAPITKEMIAQGSVGAPQPNMSSVLRIPHYITTNYQVKMEEHLSRQQQPVKHLVIHGTTGSGKTTLAQHHLQKIRIQYPQHLSRVILAETKEQYRSLLRDWAKELFPALNELLKAERDPQEQERKVDQHIQQALHKQKWCIVIDNWDQKALHIGEIEQVFLNQEVDVGQGTLLITTQGSSPFGTIHSLDLSVGFTPEESQKLLIKVMNLEEEMSITWRELGNEAALQELTKLLNHLPLAVVLAGSYLMWENKTRQSKRQALFTYVDYHAMLDQTVTELMQIYDAELGSRGRVPRDLSREEFKRLKTQEAAVDLSLKKAIQTDSCNPNMNLWQLLCFCGFLASDGIPQQLLKDYIEKILPEDKREAYETFFEMLLSEARKYSLLQFESIPSIIDSLQSLHMHRVIQKVLRDNYWQRLLVNIKNYNDAYIQKSLLTFEQDLRDPMIQSLGGPCSEAVINESFAILRAYLPHVKIWMSHTPAVTNGHYHIKQIDLQKILANTFTLLGEYSKAKELLQSVFKNLVTYYHPKSHISVAQTQQNLAITLAELGQYREAEVLYREALETSIQHYGEEENTDISEIQQNLAVTLEQLGQYQESETRYRLALAEKIKYYKTEKNISVAYTQNNLASILERLGHYNASEVLYRKVLATKKEHYKTDDHISIAKTQQNLAIILERLGYYNEAKELYIKTIKIKINHYKDKNHIDVISTQQNLAALLSQIGEEDEAKTLYQTILSVRIAYYGTENHVEVAITKMHLAEILRSEDNSNAEKLCREALQTTIDHYKTKTHIDVAEIQKVLSKILRMSGKYEEAATLSREALQTAILHYGTENHIRVTEIQINLAITLEKNHNLNEAEILYRKALKIQMHHYSTGNNTSIGITRVHLAFLLFQKGMNNDLKEALKLCELAQQCFTTNSCNAQYLKNCQQLKQFILRKIISHNEATPPSLDSPYRTTLPAQQNIDWFSIYQSNEPDKIIRRAASEGHHDHLVFLLNKHLNLLNAIDQNPHKGWTALHWAIKNNRLYCVIELLNRNACYNISDKTTEKNTAIDIAIENSNSKICQTLTKHIIKKHAKTNDHDAEKALRVAANCDDLPAVKLLIAHGVNIDAAGPESGKTALHQAVQKKHRAIIIFLLNAHANTNIEDFTGKKAIAYAENDNALINLLTETPNLLMKHE